MFQKVLGIGNIFRLRVEHHQFQEKICCLRVPKNFVEEPYWVSQNFWHRKKTMHRKEGGREGASRLSVDFFFPVPKNFIEESVCTVFQKISNGEKVFG